MTRVTDVSRSTSIEDPVAVRARRYICNYGIVHCECITFCFDGKFFASGRIGKSSGVAEGGPKAVVSRPLTLGTSTFRPASRFGVAGLLTIFTNN